MSTDSRKSPPFCIGLGEVLWDMLPSGKALGGAPANVAAHATQLGARGAVVSAVGDDSDGREILERVQAMGVDISGIQVRPELPTGLVEVAMDSAGVPTFTICSPSAWDSIAMDATLERLAGEAAAVIFGSLAQRAPQSHEGIQQFLRAVPASCMKVFDINLRPPFISREVIVESLKQADILKLNDGELPILAEMLQPAGDESAQLSAIREKFNLDLVVYTCGAKGSRMLSRTRDESHPGYPAEVVDTVGAGDAFTAAVVVGMLNKMEFARIQDMANRVASFVCSQRGAVPQLPLELAHGLR